MRRSHGELRSSKPGYLTCDMRDFGKADPAVTRLTHVIVIWIYNLYRVSGLVNKGELIITPFNIPPVNDCAGAWRNQMGQGGVVATLRKPYFKSVEISVELGCNMVEIRRLFFKSPLYFLLSHPFLQSQGSIHAPAAVWGSVLYIRPIKSS